jgi:NAD-dependent dihydropyrimidine dehydrogenase PreA subunit
MEELRKPINRKDFLRQSIKVGLAGVAATTIVGKTASAQAAKTWCDIDRSTIQWNPVVDETKCAGCGVCVSCCPNTVYKFDYTARKAKVASPASCQVGCTACANLCPTSSITHSVAPETPRDKAQKIIQKYPVLKFVLSDLEKRKATFTM